MDTALVRAWYLWCGEQAEVLWYVRKCVGPSSVAGTMWNVAEVQKPVFGSLVSRVSRL